jgi:sirohydrochlorin ferrochelatase
VTRIRSTVFLCITLLGAPALLEAQTGLLVVAHGADRAWNDRVRTTVTQVGWRHGAVATAFLMGAEKDTLGWQQGVSSLVAAGATRIVVVPLMISSHGSHYRQIEHFAGARAELPAELAHHDHGAAPARPVPMVVTPALDDAEEFAEALAEGWAELDPADRTRPILLVAHGPNSAADAEQWIADLGAVSRRLAERLPAELRLGLLRDDAGPAVRGAAVTALRDTIIALAARARDSVVVLPVLISTGAIDRVKLPADLAGLPARQVRAPLAPHPALARWIVRVAEASIGTR